MRRLTSHNNLGIFLALLIMLSACDDTIIDPFQNDSKYFTVYGYLDLLETEHSLRVVPITRRGGVIESISDPQAEIDAIVLTTDLTTGVVTRWDHTLSLLDDGTYGHVFTASFRVSQAHTYRLEIERSDGQLTTAETRIPYISNADIFEKGPEVFSDDSTHIYQDIRIPGIASPWNIQAIYLWGAGPINRRVYVPYGRAGNRTEDGGWQLRLNLSEDQAVVRENIDGSFANGRLEPGMLVSMTAAGVQIRVLDENWDPPGGIFDPEILAQPGAFSNVTNGDGFFGSVGLYIQEWNAEHLSVALGYDF